MILTLHLAYNGSTLNPILSDKAHILQPLAETILPLESLVRPVARCGTICALFPTVAHFLCFLEARQELTSSSKRYKKKILLLQSHLQQRKQQNPNIFYCLLSYY